MIILGVETSCDETGLALLDIEGKKALKIKVCSNLLASQAKIHQKYGGVYPFLAKREHQKNLPLLWKKIKEGNPHKEIKLVAVVKGPGLEPCLWTGINFSQELAEELKIPLCPVNHIEAHIIAGLINSEKDSSQLSLSLNSFLFPAVCLVVSGGHTQLILMEEFRQYRILGETRDDAAGECFDKIGRLLGLGYPGGPAIEKKASQFKIRGLGSKIKLPRPMMDQKNYDFSFSGLKTAALYHYRSRSKKERESEDYVRNMSFETQQAIIDVLINKTLRAAKEFRAQSVILGGGVTANQELRKQFQDQIGKNFSQLNLFLPRPEHSTDNALMVAVTGYLTCQMKKRAIPSGIKADANIKIE